MSARILLPELAQTLEDFTEQTQAQLLGLPVPEELAEASRDLLASLARFRDLMAAIDAHPEWADSAYLPDVTRLYREATTAGEHVNALGSRLRGNSRPGTVTYREVDR